MSPLLLIVQNPLLFVRRVRHCAGFGVQSPTDYAFVRNVIYERLPYCGYADLAAKFPHAKWKSMWQAQLLLRVANYAQAEKVVFFTSEKADLCVEAWHKGCVGSRIECINRGEGVHETLAEDGTWLVVTELNANKGVWKQITESEHVVAFDLYYVGIAFVNKKRYTEKHIINPY